MVRPAGLGTVRAEPERRGATLPDGQAVTNQRALRVGSRPAGLEPATPGLEDRLRKFLNDADLRGSVRFDATTLVATFPSVVERCGFSRQRNLHFSLHFIYSSFRQPYCRKSSSAAIASVIFK